MIDLELYGGRRSFVMHLAARALALTGAYAPLIDIDWAATRRLVFVCKGNICRSPYAVMRARELGLDAVSFGLDTVDDAPANRDALRNAATRNVDLAQHRSRKLRLEELLPGDVVLLFEPKHLTQFQALAAGSHTAPSLLGLWSAPRAPYIADPYGKSDRYFQRCFNVIDAGIRTVAQRLKRQA